MAKHAYQQMLPARSHLKWNQTTKHGCLKWNSGTTSRSNCQLNTCYPFSENSTKSDSKCSQNTMFIGNNLQCKMYLQWLWFLVADLKSWQFQTRVFVEVLKSMRLGQGIVSCRSTEFRGKLFFSSLSQNKKVKPRNCLKFDCDSVRLISGSWTRSILTLLVVRLGGSMCCLLNEFSTIFDASSWLIFRFRLTRFFGLSLRSSSFFR